MKEQRIKELHILKNNPLMPVVVSALGEDDFSNRRILNADVKERALYSGSLLDELSLTEDQKIFLLITGLDELSFEEQEKFIPLLKDRRLGGKKLPETVQFILLVKVKNKISSAILRYCLG